MTPAALLVLGALLRPGDLIVIQANCQTDDGTNTRASCRFVVKSAIYTKRPIFLAQGWKHSHHLADGMLVRAFVKTGSLVKLIEGIQMSDGRVWADDRAYERSDAPVLTGSIHTLSAPQDSPDEPAVIEEEPREPPVPQESESRR